MSSEPNDWTALAVCLEGRLRELGWTQQDLAQRAQVSQAIVRELQYNSVQRKRSPRTLEALSTTLGLHPEHLTALLHGRTPLPRAPPPSNPNHYAPSTNNSPPSTPRSPPSAPTSTTSSTSSTA